MNKENESKKYEPFSHPRWNDIPKAYVTGYKPLTKKEKERARIELEELIERDIKWRKKQKNKK